MGVFALLLGCRHEVLSGVGPGLGGDADDDDGGTGVFTSGISGPGGDGDETTAMDASTAGLEPPTTSGPAGSTSGDDDGSTSGADSSAGGSTAGAAEDSSSSSGSAIAGDPLDADLDIPEGGEECDTPGSLGECPFLEVCRFYNSEQSMCEGCESCGNLGAFCNEGTDCDILFVCFENRCTNICQLGTTECGPVDDCIDVGHPSHGACDPSAI